MTITLGWWLVPTVITLLALIRCLLLPKQGYGFEILIWMPCIIVSLVSWLIWALL